MNLRFLFNRWDRFLFQPVSTLNIALLRILWGILALANILMMLPERSIWFGQNSILGNLHTKSLSPYTLNFMSALVSDQRSVDIWFAILGLALLSVIFGFFTRISLFISWAMLVSMAHSNLLILHSGDTLLRIVGFFLIFSHSGTCLSLDAKRQRRSLTSIPLKSPWAQRVIQIQLCIVYFTTAFWKLKGPEWTSGSAVGIVLNLLEFQRLPLPDILRSSVASPYLTYFALAVEMLFPVLIWFQETRKWVLLAGLMLHLGIDWAMNIQLFQPIILSVYILFISPEFLRRWLIHFANFLTKTRGLFCRSGDCTHEHRA